jgi:hypothetical protein
MTAEGLRRIKLAREMHGPACKGHFPAEWNPVSRSKVLRLTACAYSMRKTGDHFCGMRAPVLEQEKVTNWIDSGRHAVRPGTEERIGETTGPRRAVRWKTPLRMVLVVLLTSTSMHLVHARDPDGRYANSPLKQWFDSLRSGKGPCCSDADGSAVSDVDWESKDGHYRVRLEGEWVDVPDEAVITEPNRIGRTMVWPIRGYMGVSIRCFMPGSMT